MMKILVYIVSALLFFPCLGLWICDAITTEKMDIVLIQTLLFCILAEVHEK